MHADCQRAAGGGDCSLKEITCCSGWYAGLFIVGIALQGDLPCRFTPQVLTLSSTLDTCLSPPTLRYDLPAQLDYIGDVTGQDRAAFIGFSQGGTVALAALSEQVRSTAVHIRVLRYGGPSSAVRPSAQFVNMVLLHSDRVHSLEVRVLLCTCSGPRAVSWPATWVSNTQVQTMVLRIFTLSFGPWRWPWPKPSRFLYFWQVFER